MSDVAIAERPGAHTTDRASPRRDATSSEAKERAGRKTERSGELNWPLIIAGGIAIAMFLWAAWMTKTVMDLRVAKAPFVSVRLQPLVEEYVQAQARTMTPEAEVTRQTQAFMGALDAELRARGEDGSTIMVAEAVLSKNVPDITDDVRKAVYAKVPAPGAGLTAPAGPLGGALGGLGR